MWRLRRFLLRLVTFGRPDHAEEELSREIGSHLAQLEDDFKRRGLSVEEARYRAALLCWGGRRLFARASRGRHRSVGGVAIGVAG